MKLWILRPVENLREGNDPWEPWYDKSFGFVVRATTEKAARKQVNKQPGDENRGNIKPWLDPNYSSCVELTTKGEAEIIIQDFASA